MGAEAIDAAAPRPRRGMLGFYIAGFILVAMAVFGAWFWNAWANWQFDEVEAKRRQAAAARQPGASAEIVVELPPSTSSTRASEGCGAASGNGVGLDFGCWPPPRE
jgi:hypothetical protein